MLSSTDLIDSVHYGCLSLSARDLSIQREDVRRIIGNRLPPEKVDKILSTIRHVISLSSLERQIRNNMTIPFEEVPRKIPSFEIKEVDIDNKKYKLLFRRYDTDGFLQSFANHEILSGKITLVGNKITEGDLLLKLWPNGDGREQIATELNNVKNLNYQNMVTIGGINCVHSRGTAHVDWTDGTIALAYDGSMYHLITIKFLSMFYLHLARNGDGVWISNNWASQKKFNGNFIEIQ